jgi:hypothetical protein
MYVECNRKTMKRKNSFLRRVVSNGFDKIKIFL